MSLPLATIRTYPDDFAVEELPAYEPSGAGAHLYVRFRKRGHDTLAIAKKLAQKLGVDARDVGTAGLKDRHAVTVQWASFPWPENRELPTAEALAEEGLEILTLARHGNKLKTGHLRGNRFDLVLRDIEPARVAEVVASLERAGREGIPNFYGSQRFGRGGDNVEVALAWMRGQRPVPRDTKLKRLHFSSVQSHLFDRVLRRRVEDGTWNRVLTGDIVALRNTNSTFLCEDESSDRARAESGDISPTGPMFGTKMRAPEGAPAEIERQILATLPDAEALFAKWSSLGEGARRPLRIVLEGLEVGVLSDEPNGVRVKFVLPKGAYATSVLAVACDVRDATKPSAPQTVADVPREAPAHGTEPGEEETA